VEAVTRTARTLGRGSFALALATLFLLDAGAASAAGDDQVVARPPRIQPPGRSLAGTDDTDAIALNPAQLGYIPSWELRYTHVEVPNKAWSAEPGRGDAVGIATPIAFGITSGFRLDFVRPPKGDGSAEAPAALPRMTAFSWSLAWQISSALALGTTVRRWYADGVDQLDSATSLDVGVSFRPDRHLGIAIVGRDLNAARGHTTPYENPDAQLARSFDFGVALRPTGRRDLEIGLESTLWATGKPLWSPRATLGVDVARVGRAMASFQFLNASSVEAAKDSWALTVGFEFGFGRARLGAGLVASQAFHTNPGFYASASLAGFEQPGMRDAEHGVSIRIEETPGGRGHVRLLRKLAKITRDPSIRAVVLIAKAELAGSTAHAEELGDAIATLQANGKKVVCHLEDGGGKSLLACASADKILIHPAGGLRFAGFRAQTMYFGEALQKLGIVPEFLRIRDHKTAPEQLVRSGPTPMHAADDREFLKAIEQIYVDRLSAGRKLPASVIKKSIDGGPYIADEMIAAGFADAKAFDDEIGKHVDQLVGEHVAVEKYAPELQAPKSFGPQPRIAVVYLEGDIADGRSQHIPIIGGQIAGSYTIAESLQQVKSDPSVKGVILRIESPGGSSLASDVMWREAELLSKVKPVIVSMGSVAASGGYYAAAFGAPIYANRATLTGSIGIFYGKADVSGMLDKLGIHVVTQRTAPHADAESLYRPFSDDEIPLLSNKVEQFYAVFLDRVARGRHLSVEEVDAVGRGKVWFGDAALKNKLVDRIGGFDDALRTLRKELELPPDVALEELPLEKNGLLDLVLGTFGVAADVPSVAALPKAIAPYAAAILPFVVFRPDEALALYEGIGEP
jgi:protease-4